jgi:hypothetical protein
LGRDRSATDTRKIRVKTPNAPRRAERFLEALGAKNAFHDDIVGDLAQEFTTRASRDGERSARRWYYRETVRATPHLLLDSVRGLGRADISRVLGTVAFAYVMTAMLSAFVMMTILGIALATGFPWNGFAATLQARGSSSFALRVLFTIPGPIAGGFIAARSDRRAPVITALVLGVLWASLSVIASMPFGMPLLLRGTPTWYRVVAPFVVVAGTLVGAGFGVGTTRPRHDMSQAAAPVA